MDNSSLQAFISKIPELKYKYLGSFSAQNSIPVDGMKPNTFQIVNTSNSIGEHWVVIVKGGASGNMLYFGDSMGKRVEQYKNLQKFHKRISHQVVKRRVQVMPDLCGFYTIYIAFKIFAQFELSDYKPYLDFTEYELIKFVNKYNFY